jgi:hypothetical protein
LPAGAATPGWTSVVPIRMAGSTITDLLSYNATSGTVVYSKGSYSAGPPETFGRTVVYSTTARAGWTSISPLKSDADRRTNFLWYDIATGLAQFSMTPSNGPIWAQELLANVDGLSGHGLTYGRGPFAVHGDARAHVYTPASDPDRQLANAERVGWTTIVPLDLNGDGLTDLLSYSATTGLATYSIGKSSPSSSTDVDYPQQVVKSVNAGVGWTSIVPLKTASNQGYSDLLFYNAASGLTVYTVGTYSPATGVYDQVTVNAGTARPGWTSIVPMNIDDDLDHYTDLLSYNAATGEAVYSLGPGQGVVARTAIETGWTAIVPMMLRPADRRDDLLFYK